MRFLRLMKNMPKMIAASRATPPITPPTIGPTGVEDFSFGTGVGVIITVLVDWEEEVVVGSVMKEDVVNLRVVVEIMMDVSVESRANGENGFPSCPEYVVRIV